MLGKLFKKKETPQNDGTQTQLGEVTGNFESVPYITLKIDGEEVSQEVAPKLTIGSEVGDLIIDHPSISGRHCTFLVSRDIISVIDHSSENGTFLNKKPLTPGKSFFVNKVDKLKLGELVARLEYKQVPVSLNPPAVHTAPASSDLEPLEDEGTSEITSDPDSTGEFPMDIPESGTEEMMQEMQYKIPDEGTAEMMTAEGPEADFDLDDDGPGLELDSLEVEEPEPDTKADEEEDEEITPLKADRTHGKGAQEFTMQSAEGLSLAGQTKVGKKPDYYIPEADEEDDLDSGEKTSFLSKLAFWKRKSKEKKPKLKAAGGKKQKKKTAAPKVVAPPASSGILRMIAFCFDAVWVLSLHTVAGPIEEYKNFFDSVPGTLEKTVVPLYQEFIAPYYDQYLAEYSFISDFFGFIKELPFFNEVLSFLSLILTFRVLMALFLKVSFGQFLLGIRHKSSSFLVGRVKGFMREFVGMITMPFIIFDLPALIGKRTLKEVLTLSRLTTPYPVASGILIFLWLPVSGLVYLSAPLFKGFEVKEAILVDDVSERKVEPFNYTQPIYNKALGLRYDKTDQIKVLPLIDISLKEGKKFRKFGLMFYDMDKSTTVRVLKTKSHVNLTAILKNYLDQNPFASEYFQPKIHSYVRSAAMNSKNFKQNLKKTDILTIGTELRGLIRDTFTLNLETLPDFVVNQGVIFGGHVSLREDIQSLFDYKIQAITFTNFSNIQGLLFTHNLGRENVYSYIPQNSLTPDVYQFTKDISNIKIAKLIQYVKLTENPDPSDGTDFTSTYIDSLSQGIEVPNLNEASGELMSDIREIAAHQLSIQADTQELKRLIAGNISSLEIDSKEETELYRGLVSLQNALNQQDYGFFGIPNPNEAPQQEAPIE